jgi:hypothetical protein
VWHGGDFTGTFALMTMLPDRGVGVAVFTNSAWLRKFSPTMSLTEYAAKSRYTLAVASASGALLGLAMVRHQFG